MKSPTDFLVEPVGNKRYANKKNIGGVDFIVSSSEEDHKFSNREALVIETPLRYKGPIKKGDTLLVHHNVFKYYNDMYGRQKSGRSFFRENTFLIDSEQFFLYKQNGQWKSYDRYCFVKPIKVKQDYHLHKNVKFEPLVGEMKYPSEYLQKQGIKSGDIVMFNPNMEYEFQVDGELLYRIYDHQVPVVLPNYK